MIAAHVARARGRSHIGSLISHCAHPRGAQLFTGEHQQGEPNISLFSVSKARGWTLPRCMTGKKSDGHARLFERGAMKFRGRKREREEEEEGQ